MTLVTWRKSGQGCADVEVHDRLQVLGVLVPLLLQLLLLHDSHAQEGEELPQAGSGGVEPAGVQATHQLLHLHRMNIRPSQPVSDRMCPSDTGCV